MICIVLHCDHSLNDESCNLEQSYPLGVLLRDKNDNESLADCALRLGSQYGWRSSGHERAGDRNEIEQTVLCPDHSGVPQE